MAPRTRSPKPLKLPSIVLEAKAFLDQNNSKSLSVMKKLTESEDAEQQQALIKMWISLENSIEKLPKKHRYPSDLWLNFKKPVHPGDMWPHFFVSYVQMFSSFPPYFYQPKSERKELIADIKKHIDGLTEALKHNKFDHRLDYAESRNALYFVERMGFVDNFRSENSAAEKPTVSEILYRLLETIEADVSPLRQTRRDSFEEARPLVYNLGKYLKEVHGEVSNVVLATVTKAIMGKEYTESDIHHILERERLGKTRKK